jgi:hypothetical protein
VALPGGAQVGAQLLLVARRSSAEQHLAAGEARDGADKRLDDAYEKVGQHAPQGINNGLVDGFAPFVVVALDEHDFGLGKALTSAMPNTLAKSVTASQEPRIWSHSSSRVNGFPGRGRWAGKGR